MNGFVVIVHEPHWSTPGQFQLINGLNHLISENPQTKFKFLVEGDFEGSDRSIPVQDMLDMMTIESSKESQIYGLVRDFLIDGPLAYRMLYNSDIHAMAIDNYDALRNTPRDPGSLELYEASKKIIRIIDELSEEYPDDADVVAESLGLLNLYFIADMSNLNGPVLIDYYGKMQEMFQVLSDALRQFSAIKNLEDVKFFESERDKCKDLKIIFSQALKRDTTMADFIENEARKTFGRTIPVAFIGSFHTQGILELLDSNIGYVVIESSTHSPVSEDDLDRFNDALTNRDEYFNKLLKGKAKNQFKRFRKLRTHPSKSEYSSYRQILENYSKDLKRQRIELAENNPFTSEINMGIQNAIDANGNICHADVVLSSGGGRAPPPPFNNAFASFKFEPADNRPLLTIYDKKNDNWKSPDRLNFLRKIAFLPASKKARPKCIKATFFEIPNSERMFLNVYDGISDKFYLFEVANEIDLHELYKNIKTFYKDHDWLQIEIGIINPNEIKEDIAYG